jgi:hypothetical protein
MARDLRRLVRILIAAVAGLLYVWFTAVRLAPEVKRRKEAGRRARAAGIVTKIG